MLPPADAMRWVSAAMAAGSRGWPRTVTFARPTPARPVVADSVFDGDIEGEIRAQVLHGRGHPLVVRRLSHEHTEHQASADDQLLDIDNFQSETGEAFEQGRRHARTIGAGEGQQDRGVGQVRGGDMLGHRD